MLTSKDVEVAVVCGRCVVTARTSYLVGGAVLIEGERAPVPSSQASVGIDLCEEVSVCGDVALIESAENLKVTVVNESAMAGQAGRKRRCCGPDADPPMMMRAY